MARRLKMKKAKPSTLLSIDSPMVIFHTDLEGAFGGEHTVDVPLPELSDGPPAPHSVKYIAMCERRDHPPDMEGATEEGLWFSGYREQFDEARALAGGHLDGEAFVLLYINDVLVGPAIRP